MMLFTFIQQGQMSIYALKQTYPLIEGTEYILL